MRPLVATHIGTFCTDGSKPSVNSTSLPQNPQSGAPSCYRMTAGYRNPVRFATCNCHTCNTTFGITVSTHSVNIKTSSLYTHRYKHCSLCYLFEIIIWFCWSSQTLGVCFLHFYDQVSQSHTPNIYVWRDELWFFRKSAWFNHSTTKQQRHFLL